MGQTAQRFRVYEGVGPPPVNQGPPARWGHLPVETIMVNDLIEMTLDAVEARHLVNAIRSHAGRIARKSNKKFSVRLTDYGIGIWRIQ